MCQVVNDDSGAARARGVGTTCPICSSSVGLKLTRNESLRKRFVVSALLTLVARRVSRKPEEGVPPPGLEPEGTSTSPCPRGWASCSRSSSSWCSHPGDHTRGPDVLGTLAPSTPTASASVPSSGSRTLGGDRVLAVVCFSSHFTSEDRENGSLVLS